MKLKFLLASLMLIGATSTSLAQSEESIGFGGKKNDIKIDFNCGWFLSEFVDRYGNGHRGLFGGGYSLMYEHVFNKGYGFGINGIIEQGEDCEITTGVIAPSFVHYGSKGNWTFGYSLGLGYGKFKIDSYRYGHDDANGLGYFVQANVERRINKWLGIGAGLRILDITAKKPDNSSYYDSHSYGTGSVRFTIGPRFYF